MSRTLGGGFKVCDSNICALFSAPSIMKLSGKCGTVVLKLSLRNTLCDKKNLREEPLWGQLDTIQTGVRCGSLTCLWASHSSDWTVGRGSDFRWCLTPVLLCCSPSGLLDYRSSSGLWVAYSIVIGGAMPLPLWSAMLSRRPLLCNTLASRMTECESWTGVDPIWGFPYCPEMSPPVPILGGPL